MNRPSMIKRVLMGAVASTALLGGVAAAFPASADAGTRVTGTPGAPSATHTVKYGCVVTGNNVYFRAADGTKLGQVHVGQKMDVYSGHPGVFYGGWLWGDDRFVYVHSNFVRC